MQLFAGEIILRFSVFLACISRLTGHFDAAGASLTTALLSHSLLA